jgi:omega-6 fatty acid desaturase (delta-12 desaturase)
MEKYRQIVKSIPREYFRIDPVKSWTTLARCLLMIVISQYLLTLVDLTNGQILWAKYLVMIPLWLYAGLSIVGLFVLGHDCGHYAFAKSKLTNVLVGHFTMSFMMTGYYNWMRGHNQHHRYTQMRAVDPDWPERMVTREEFKKLNLGDKLFVVAGLGSPIGIFTGFIFSMVRRIFPKTLIPQMELNKKQHREIIISNIVMLSVQIALITWLYQSFGSHILLKHFGVPAFIGMTTGALLTFLHHTNVDSPVFDKDEWTPFKGNIEATYDVRFPRIFEWLWLDINIHVPHHLAPSLPWYHLRPVAKLLKEQNSDIYNEKRFSLKILMDLWKHPLIEEDVSKDRYHMSGLRP